MCDGGGNSASVMLDPPCHSRAPERAPRLTAVTGYGTRSPIPGRPGRRHSSRRLVFFGERDEQMSPVRHAGYRHRPDQVPVVWPRDQVAVPGVRALDGRTACRPAFTRAARRHADGELGPAGEIRSKPDLTASVCLKECREVIQWGSAPRVPSRLPGAGQVLAAQAGDAPGHTVGRKARGGGSSFVRKALAFRSCGVRDEEPPPWAFAYLAAAGDGPGKWTTDLQRSETPAAWGSWRMPAAAAATPSCSMP